MNYVHTRIAGLSLAGALFLLGCGGTSVAEHRAATLQTQSLPKLETRTTYQSPIHLQITDEQEHNISLAWDPLPANNDMDGIAIYAEPVARDFNLSDANRSMHFRRAIFLYDNSADHATFTHLDDNQSYLFRVASFTIERDVLDSGQIVTTRMNVYGATGSWSEKTAKGTTLLHINDISCLKGCCTSWCDRSVTPPVKKYGAKLSWQEDGTADTLHIYRYVWDDTTASWQPDPAPEGTLLAQALVSDKSYLDTEAQLNKKYKYVVKRVLDGRESNGVSVVVKMY